MTIKALANEDTLLRTNCCRHKCFPICPRAQHLLRTQILCPGHKKCFWFCSETLCVCNKCFPVCTAQETSWATMCPQQSVLVCQYNSNNSLTPKFKWALWKKNYELLTILIQISFSTQYWTSLRQDQSGIRAKIYSSVIHDPQCSRKPYIVQTFFPLFESKQSYYYVLLLL